MKREAAKCHRCSQPIGWYHNFDCPYKGNGTKRVEEAQTNRAQAKAEQPGDPKTGAAAHA